MKKMIVFFSFLSIALLLLLKVGAANANEVKGYVFCDDNQNGIIDFYDDSRFAGVGVNVENDDGSWSGSDITRGDVCSGWNCEGWYFILLPEGDDDYILTLDESTLPSDFVYVQPASGVYNFQVVAPDWYIYRYWLIDSATCREAECSIGDYVWEDANRNGCQDPDERPIEGVIVELLSDCNDPVVIDTTTTDAEGFYEFTGLDCSAEYKVKFGDAGEIYDYTRADQECVDGDPDESDKQDSDCGENGFSGCITFPDPVNFPNNPTIDCGYVCEGKIGDYVWLDENEDGCQDEINTGIAGVDVTLSEDCVDRENPQIVKTDSDGFYEFAGLCPGAYFVEFDDGIPNTDPGQVCDGDPDVSDEKDSNCGDEALQCVTLTRGNPEDPTIDCGKVGPCIELEKRVSGDSGLNFFDADNCSDNDVPFTTDDSVYELEVTNCGKEAVELDRIIDQDLGINLVLDPVVTIPSGGTVTFTNGGGQTQGLLQKEGACPNTDGEFDNTATVSGMGVGSNLPVEATDPACVKCGPCIDLIKEVSVDDGMTWSDANDADCSDGPTTDDPAEYRLTIENCGGEELVDLVINDDVLGITNVPVADPLPVGGSIFLTKDDIPALALDDLCPLTPDDPGVINNFLRNIARVDAKGSPSMTPVFDEDPACVKCCPLDVEKEVFPEEIVCDSGTDGAGPDDCICPCEDSGTDTGTDGEAECIVEKVTYTYTVRNTGDVDLLDVTVFDDQLGIIAEFPMLAAGGTEIITVPDVCLCEETTNKVTVTGSLGDGTICTAMDEATVTTDLDCIDTGTDRP